MIRDQSRRAARASLGPAIASPQDLAQQIFGPGWMPSTMREDVVQYRLERAVELVESVIYDFNYTPEMALKLYHVVRNFLAWAKAYLGDDSDDFVKELAENLPRTVPKDTAGVAKYFNTLMHVYEKAVTRVAQGQYVRPEIPIDVRLIGRDITDALTELGVGVLSKEELDKAVAELKGQEEAGTEKEESDEFDESDEDGENVEESAAEAEANEQE